MPAPTVLPMSQPEHPFSLALAQANFLGEGLQTAAGVPLQCDEGADFKTFRIGLFGLDKLGDIGRTVDHLDRALSHIV